MAPKTNPTDTEGGKLDAETWVRAALEVLSVQGVDGVRIEVLAKKLGVTKGSFYWHFKDREMLYATMLSHWRKQATVELIDRMNRGMNSPEERLRWLLRRPMVGRRSAFAADVELAIRLWGRRNPLAHAALKEVDELRLRHIAGQMEAIGLSPAHAIARAVLAYAYLRVAATLVEKSDEELMEHCENLLIGKT